MIVATTLTATNIVRVPSLSCGFHRADSIVSIVRIPSFGFYCINSIQLQDFIVQMLLCAFRCTHSIVCILSCAFHPVHSIVCVLLYIFYRAIERRTLNDDKTDAEMTQEQQYPNEPTDVDTDVSLCTPPNAPQRPN